MQSANSARAAVLTFYFPVFQELRNSRANFALRTTDPSAMANLRNVIRSLDASIRA
jgi:hypothetical protein